MKNISRFSLIKVITNIIVFICLFFLPIQEKAYAYVDPGSGSFIFQILIASFITALFSLKKLRVKINEALNKLFKKSPNKQDDQE